MNNDQSARTDGERASDEMTGGIVAEFHKRIAAIEADNADLRRHLENARDQGSVPYPGFVEHVSHVMQKNFFHDKPDGFDERYARSESERAIG